MGRLNRLPSARNAHFGKHIVGGSKPNKRQFENRFAGFRHIRADQRVQLRGVFGDPAGAQVFAQSPAITRREPISRPAQPDTQQVDKRQWQTGKQRSEVLNHSSKFFEFQQKFARIVSCLITT